MHASPRKRTLGVVLFPGFELLDVFGPLEVFANQRLASHLHVLLVAQATGPVASAQGARVIAERSLDDAPRLDWLLVPGGQGTRSEVDDRLLLDWIARRAASAELTLSVCTGSALLARAGVLDGKRATTNKRAFAWVAAQGTKTEWIKEARWVDDGSIVTSSGISAGIDAALHVVATRIDATKAEELAVALEYEWHRDAGWDPFAAKNGLV